MNNRIERLEKNKARNNRILTELTIDTNNKEKLTEILRNFTERTIGVKAEIKKTIKIGPKTCKIEINKFRNKQEIMANKNKLKYKKHNQESLFMVGNLSKHFQVKIFLTDFKTDSGNDRKLPLPQSASFSD